jgi:hypothetical protein
MGGPGSQADPASPNGEVVARRGSRLREAPAPAFGFHECYAELKAKAMRGDALTEDELEFVGATVHVHDTSGGWRQPTDSSWEIDSLLSAEDATVLQALMSVGTSADVEFLA